MCLMCTNLLLLDLLLTSPRPHSKLSAPLSPHSASTRTMDLSTTSPTYKAQHSLDLLSQYQEREQLEATLQLSPQSETIIRTGPSLNWVRQPATSSEKQILPAASYSSKRKGVAFGHRPCSNKNTSKQVFLYRNPLTTCSIYWSALRGLEKLHMDSTFVFRDRGLSNLYHNRQNFFFSIQTNTYSFPKHNARAHLHWASAKQKRKVPHRQCTAAHRRTLPPSAKSPTVPVFIPLLW